MKLRQTTQVSYVSLVSHLPFCSIQSLKDESVFIDVLQYTLATDIRPSVIFLCVVTWEVLDEMPLYLPLCSTISLIQSPGSLKYAYWGAKRFKEVTT